VNLWKAQQAQQPTGEREQPQFRHRKVLAVVRQQRASLLDSNSGDDRIERRVSVVGNRNVADDFR